MPRMQMTTATTMKAAFFAMLDRVGQVLADDSRVWAEMHCAAQDAFSSQLDSVIGASPLVNTRPDQFPSWATPAPQAKRVSAQRKGPPAPKPPRPSSTDHDAADVACQADIIQALRETKDPVSATTLADLCALDTERVSGLLVKLVRAGRVVKTGAKKGSRYALPAGSVTMTGSAPRVEDDDAQG